MNGHAGSGHGGVLIVRGDEPEVSQLGMRGQIHQEIPEEYKSKVRVPRQELEEILNELPTSFARFDPAGVQDKRRRTAVLSAKNGRVGRGRDINTDAHYILVLAFKREASPQH